MPTARARLDELYARVDAFFDRTSARFPGASGVTCHAGCADCCRRFSVTALEAEAIAEGLAALSPSTRASIAARAARASDVCPALDEGGRCLVYAVRPVICRTHGLPIRFAPGGPRSLPVVGGAPTVDACPKNFRGHDLAALPRDAVLDQATVSTVLGALDAARAGETGRPRGERVDLAALLGGA
jgi:hypothetical protein